MGDPECTVFIIDNFHICQLTYCLKFICNPPNQSLGAFVLICGFLQSNENFESPDVLQAEDRQGGSLSVSLSHCKGPFLQTIIMPIFTLVIFFFFLVGDFMV